MTGHNCPTCGCRVRSARTARSPFKKFPAPTYKGGWPQGTRGRDPYIPLDAPVRVLAALARDFNVSGMVQPREERATINGIEIPNETLEVAS